MYGLTLKWNALQMVALDLWNALQMVALDVWAHLEMECPTEGALDL